MNEAVYPKEVEVPDQKITKPTLKSLNDDHHSNHLQKVVVMYPLPATETYDKGIVQKALENERAYDVFLRIAAVVLLIVVLTIIFRTIF